MNKKFLTCRGGNVAMMFGLMLIPLLVGVGMAVDFTRQQNARNLIQEAADAAVLRAALMEGASPEEIHETAEKMFLANLSGEISIEHFDFSIVKTDGGSFVVEASVRFDPLFIQFGGLSKLDIDVVSEAGAREGRGLEMVIAFDTTASMGFGTTWQTALATLEDVLEQLAEFTGDDNFYISLLPFSDRVPVGVGHAGWLDGAAPAGWNGCMEPREEVDGAFQWSLDDDPPDAEPFEASIPGVTGGVSLQWAAAPICPSVPLTGPTGNISAVITAASGLTQGGTGRFDDAMAWAWRLVSPRWSGQWGVAGYPASDTQDRRKVVVFVTDGRTEAYTHELSMMRSWGFNEGSDDGFSNMVHVCDRMKDDDIEIFMFRINGNIHAESYMRDCASSVAHYQAINDNSELAVAFAGLLEKLGDLRLMR